MLDVGDKVEYKGKEWYICGRTNAPSYNLERFKKNGTREKASVQRKDFDKLKELK